MGPEFAELEAKVHVSVWQRHGRALYGQAVMPFASRSQPRAERHWAQDKLHVRRHIEIKERAVW